MLAPAFFSSAYSFGVQRAQADADAQIGFAPQRFDERQDHLAHHHRVFAGLDVHVGDARGTMMDEQFGEFIVPRAEARQPAIVAAHAAIDAVLAAKVGDFHHRRGEKPGGQTG